jgi:asparagine synthase (glutamine-hydrolysing)
LAADVAAALDGHRPEYSIAAHYAAGPPGDPLGCMITADVNTLLPDDFLTKVDRASMAFGLEVRPPLVDHELLELAGRIPSTLKIHQGQTKWLLKKTYEDDLPNGLAWRKKHGFDLPIDPWLRGPLREVFEADVLGPNAAVRELVDRPAAERMYRRHVAGLGRHGNVLWSLLILAHWAERYLTAPTPTGSAAS